MEEITESSEELPGSN